jgi:hypothetical protein
VQKHALPAAITEALAQHLRDNLREAGQQQRGGGAEADSVSTGGGFRVVARAGGAARHQAGRKMLRRF